MVMVFLPCDDEADAAPPPPPFDLAVAAAVAAALCGAAVPEDPLARDGIDAAVLRPPWPRLLPPPPPPCAPPPCVSLWQMAST
mmetsp:Transcript_5816/g.17922  ORF Transcript_5816/g.17922 Transcript_5816/m.17922 type:complete len:83 (-) Transcript_5816:1452-1700(-)